MTITKNNFENNVIKIDELEIKVYFKKVKNYNLRINTNKEIVCNVPYNETFNAVNEFIYKKLNWIKSKIKRNEKFCDFNNIYSGALISYLGNSIKIIFTIDKKYDCNFENNVILIHLKNNFDIKKPQKLFLKWLNKKAQKLFECLTTKYYKKYFFNFNFPQIKCRSLKSIWGSYNKKTHAIVYNIKLIQYNIQIIEYVVLHELTHMLYLNHGEDFYTFINKCMPDWKTRKKALSYL